MKLGFQEIKDEELHYEFDESSPWVMEIIGKLDEHAAQISRPANWKPRSRATRISLNIHRIDELVSVRGTIETQLFLLCSLCADGFPFPVKRDFNALYTINPDFAETPKEKSHSTFEPKDLIEDEDDLDPEDEFFEQKDLDGSDYEVTLLDEPILDFANILNEQIVLHIPMQPKPPITDDGDCQKCGRAQEALYPPKKEPLQRNPFAALKNWKREN
jgi:uncharacterized metal-binding protein YceD (DUF177 family)